MENEAVEQLTTISDRLAFHRRRGKKFLAKAEEILKSKAKAGAFLKYDDAAMYFFKSSISYRICGKWREGGDALKRCAEMHETLKLYLEAATLLTEVAEIYIKVDKGEAVATQRKAISMYCDAGKFDIAGRMERKIADMHYTNKHWEEAAFHYKKAANFLSGEQMLDQSDACLELAANCMMEVKEYLEAQSLWELVASGCVQSNLRRFQARDKLFMGILCMIGIAYKYPVHELDDTVENSVEAIVARTSTKKYEPVLDKIKEYERIDYLWTAAKEVEFFKNIIEFRLKFEVHNFVDHIYFWNNVRPLSRHQLIILKVPVDEINDELDRRAELRRLEDMRKTLAAERKVKRAEMKAKLEALGIMDGITIEMMEAEYEEDEARVIASATQATLRWGLRGLKKSKRKMKLNADGEAVPDSARLSEEGSAKLSAKLLSDRETGGGGGVEGEENEEGTRQKKKMGGGDEDNLHFADEEDEEEEEEEEEEQAADGGGAKKEEKKTRKKREKKSE